MKHTFNNCPFMLLFLWIYIFHQVCPLSSPRPHKLVHLKRDYAAPDCFNYLDHKRALV